jgi:hypothetical protein
VAPADLSRGGLNRGAVNNPDKAEQYGTGAAAMVFLYVVVFSSSWLMIPFIYPTEIFPTWLRAKGNAFGVAGWAVGYGAGSLLVPVMFAGIQEKVSPILFANIFISNFSFLPSDVLRLRCRHVRLHPHHLLFLP